MTSAPAIQLQDVTKKFFLKPWKPKWAVNELSLSIPTGQVVGLLGPNGSGKSTTLKMILGFLRPTAGQIFVCGIDASNRAARARIGYLPENPRFPKFLSAQRLLLYYGGLQGLKGTEKQKRADGVLEWVGLRRAAEEKVAGFSKGMIQRLAIAQALIATPEILILDEPMSGLDPIGRVELRELIASLHARLPATTIFFSSHLLEDVEQLCGSVAILQGGRLKRFCTTAELLGNETMKFNVTLQAQRAALGAWGREAAEDPLGLTVPLEGPEKLSEFLQAMHANKIPIVAVRARRQTLETALYKEVTP